LAFTVFFADCAFEVISRLRRRRHDVEAAPPSPFRHAILLRQPIRQPRLLLPDIFADTL
jgi:hypothetical protein